MTSDRTTAPVSLWHVAILALGPAVALGWARFAYGLLLPAMQEQLAWTYSEAGAINTGEAAGYLIGALLADPIGRALGLRKSYTIGMVLAAAGLLGCGLTSSFVLLLALRILTGVGAAFTFVAGASLVAAGTREAQSASGLSIYTAGVGFGIVVTALSLPPLLAGGNWHWGWIMLGSFSLVSCLLVQCVLSRFPASTTADAEADGAWLNWRPLQKLIPLSVAYTLFGMGYVGYMTFFIAYLKQHGVSTTDFPLIWIILGSGVMLASFIWGTIFPRLRGGRAFATVHLVLIGGVILPLLGSSMAAYWASSFLVGCAVLAVPPAVFYVARNTLDPKHWTGAISALTIVFGLGQTVGPIIIGGISDWYQSVGAGLFTAALILAAGAVIALFQPAAKKKTTG